MNGLRALSALVRHGQGVPSWAATCSIILSDTGGVVSGNGSRSCCGPYSISHWGPTTSSSSRSSSNGSRSWSHTPTLTTTGTWGPCTMQTAHVSTSSATNVPSTSQPTAAAAAAPAATPKKIKGAKGGGGSMAAAEQLQAAAGAAELPSEQALKEAYQASRLESFWANVLSRELLLKLNIDNVNQLPQLKHVEVSIHARDTLKASNVEKWQMLLHALALEYVTGQPAQFTQSRQKYYRARNAVTGVHVKLTKRRAYDFLEKLVYVVLPSQNAFEGLLLKSLDKGCNIHFRVSKMANYPDFEELYETFENLGGFHVNITLSNVARAPARSRLLLTGLQLPVFARRRRAGGEEEEEQEPKGATAAAASSAADESDGASDAEVVRT